MNENTHIQNLIDKFLTASTTEAEERELSDFFANCDNVPPQWQDLAIMFGGFRAEKANVSLPKNNRKIPVVRLAWIAAASVALWLGISFFMGSSETDNNTETAVEVAATQLPEAERDSINQYEPVSEILSENPSPIQNVVSVPDEISAPDSSDLSVSKIEPTLCFLYDDQFMKSVAEIEDDSLKAELEKLSLEFELQMLNAEFEKAVEKSKTIYVSL